MAGVLAEAACLGLFLFLASGWGAWAPADWWCASGSQTVAARYVIGLLVLAAWYAAGAQLGATFTFALIGTVLFLAVGGFGLVRAGHGAPRLLVRHAAIALGVAGFWLVASGLAGNPGAIDPWYYAAGPFLVLQRDWVAANVVPLPNAADVLAARQLVSLTRAASGAILWPIALVGNGLGVGQVTAAGTGLLLAAGVLCKDLVRWDTPRWIGCLLGIAGLGVYNAIAILSGGQVQQGMALETTLGCVWLAVSGASPLARVLPFVVGGFVVSATYTEFLLAMPLYLLLVSTVLRLRPAGTLVLIVGLAAGWAVEQLLTMGGSMAYLVNQSENQPGWMPLSSTPASAAEVLLDVVLQTRPPLVVLPLVVLGGLAFWWRDRNVGPPVVVSGAAGVATTTSSEVIPRHVLGLLVLLGAACAVFVGRSPNLNYAVFKFAGWVGPGLLLFGWWIASACGVRLRRVARALVLTLALARAASLLYGGHEVLTLGRPDRAQQFPRQVGPDGGCVVSVDTSTTMRTLQAIAGSAASIHNCALAVGPVSP